MWKRGGPLGSAYEWLDMRTPNPTLIQQYYRYSLMDKVPPSEGDDLGSIPNIDAEVSVNNNEELEMLRALYRANKSGWDLFHEPCDCGCPSQSSIKNRAALNIVTIVRELDRIYSTASVA